MNRLQTSLHALSLSCSIALGATCWALWQRPAPLPPSGEGKTQAAAPLPEDPGSARSIRHIQHLEEQIASLRLRLSSVEDARPEPPAAQPPAPAAPRPPSSPAELLAALSDPKIQANLLETLGDPKVRAAALAALDDPKVQARLQQLAQETGQDESGMTARIFRGNPLPDEQRREMDRLLGETAQKVTAIFGKVPDEMTPAQARLAVEQQRIETDQKALTILGPERFQTYQEGIRPWRESTDRWMEESLGEAEGTWPGPDEAPSSR